MRISDIVHHKIYSHTLSMTVIRLYTLVHTYNSLCSLSIRSPEILYAYTHRQTRLVQYLPAFVSATQQKQPQSAMEKMFEERCEQVYFNHFYGCDEFYSISNVNGLTNNIFFPFFSFLFISFSLKHILGWHLVTINSNSDSSFAFSLFYWIALCSIFM